MSSKSDGPILGAKPSFVERLFGDFSIKRGLKGFGIGLLISPILIFLKSFHADEFHWDGVPIVMLLVACFGGLWGLFTKKVFPL